MTAENDAQANDVPSPDPELQRLEPLLDKWQSEEQTQDTILSPGVKVTNEEEIYWLEGGYFLVQTYHTVLVMHQHKKVLITGTMTQIPRNFVLSFFQTMAHLQMMVIDMPVS